MNVLMMLLVPVMTACSIVSPGERGVRIYMGHASSEALEPGPHLWFPVIAGIADIDVQIQKSDVKTSAASKDMQTVTTDIAINWSLSPDQVVSVYKTLGDETDIFNRIISPATSEVLKAAMAQMTAEQILSKRLDLKNAIDAGLKARLQPYGVNATDVSIIDLEFSPEFSHAIEEKQINEQQAQAAKYVADKAVQEANAEVNRARGQAEAQKLLQSSLTPAMIQKLYIEKWNGVLPQVQGGGGTLLNMKIPGAQ